MTDAEHTLTVILGAVLGSLVRSGSTPDEIRVIVEAALRAISEIDQAEVQRLMEPVVHYAVATAKGQS